MAHTKQTARKLTHVTDTGKSKQNVVSSQKHTRLEQAAKRGDENAQAKVMKRKKDAQRKKEEYIRKRGEKYKGRPASMYTAENLEKEIKEQKNLDDDTKATKNPLYTMINTKTHQQKQVPMYVTDSSLFTKKGPKRLISDTNVQVKHYKMFMQNCLRNDNKKSNDILDKYGE